MSGHKSRSTDKTTGRKWRVDWPIKVEKTKVCKATANLMS